MEKEKKVAKKSVKTTAKPAKATAPKTTAKKSTPAKAKKVEVVEEVKVEAVASEPAKVEVTPVVEQPKAEKTEAKKPVTLNQELNLIIGLFSILTIIAFCFAFQGGDAEILGWELLLKSGAYSGVFKGIMILYVISIFIDCILAVRIDTENEILNIVEKVLYAFTLIMNFVTVAILVSLIEKIGIGLIMLLIISIVSAIVKLARIYAKRS